MSTTDAPLCPLYKAALIGAALGPTPSVACMQVNDWRDGQFEIHFTRFRQVISCDGEACAWWRRDGCLKAKLSLSDTATGS